MIFRVPREDVIKSQISQEIEKNSGLDEDIPEFTRKCMRHYDERYRYKKYDLRFRTIDELLREELFVQSERYLQIEDESRRREIVSGAMRFIRSFCKRNRDWVEEYFERRIDFVKSYFTLFRDYYCRGLEPDFYIEYKESV